MASSSNGRFSRNGAHPEPAVVLQDAERWYGPVRAVAPISLEVRPGESVAFLGPSGGGKSTLLMMIAGEIGLTRGRVGVSGQALGGVQPGKDRAKLVGMIHQQFDLVPTLSALQNVLAGRLGEWGLVRSLVSLVIPQERDVAMQALERVGVADRAKLRAGRLSGGEQQRVAIARLLVQDPLVVIADEPVASLDPVRAEEVLDLLLGVTKGSGKTLVASMHSVELARRSFDRLIGLRNGEIQFDLASDDIPAETLDRLYHLEGLRSESQPTAQGAFLGPRHDR